VWQTDKEVVGFAEQKERRQECLRHQEYLSKTEKTDEEADFSWAYFLPKEPTRARLLPDAFLSSRN